MTMSELAQQARFLVDEYGLDWLVDNSVLEYSLYKALQQAYQQYALETKAFRVERDGVSVANQGIYAFSDFGTGGPPKSGARLFQLTSVIYDCGGTAIELHERSEHRLPANWRTAASGTPESYIRWGDRSIRLIPATLTASKTIRLEGYELPDLTTFAASSESPAMNDLDQNLLPIWAAILLTVRDPSAENQVRSSILYPRWKEGIDAAYKRIHPIPEAVVAGRNTGQVTGRIALEIQE